MSDKPDPDPNNPNDFLRITREQIAEIPRDKLLDLYRRHLASRGGGSGNVFAERRLTPTIPRGGDK